MAQTPLCGAPSSHGSPTAQARVPGRRVTLRRPLPAALAENPVPVSDPLDLSVLPVLWSNDLDSQTRHLDPWTVPRESLQDVIRLFHLVAGLHTPATLRACVELRHLYAQRHRVTPEYIQSLIQELKKLRVPGLADQGLLAADNVEEQSMSLLTRQLQDSMTRYLDICLSFTLSRHPRIHLQQLLVDWIRRTRDDNKTDIGMQFRTEYPDIHAVLCPAVPGPWRRTSLPYDTVTVFRGAEGQWTTVPKDLDPCPLFSLPLQVLGLVFQMLDLSDLHCLGATGLRAFLLLDSAPLHGSFVRRACSAKQLNGQTLGWLAGRCPRVRVISTSVLACLASHYGRVQFQSGGAFEHRVPRFPGVTHLDLSSSDGRVLLQPLVNPVMLHADRRLAELPATDDDGSEHTAAETKDASLRDRGPDDAEAANKQRSRGLESPWRRTAASDLAIRIEARDLACLYPQAWVHFHPVYLAHVQGSDLRAKLSVRSANGFQGILARWLLWEMDNKTVELASVHDVVRWNRPVHATYLAMHKTLALGEDVQALLAKYVSFSMGLEASSFPGGLVLWIGAPSEEQFLTIRSLTGTHEWKLPDQPIPERPVYRAVCVHRVPVNEARQALGARETLGPYWWTDQAVERHLDAVAADAATWRAAGDPGTRAVTLRLLP